MKRFLQIVYFVSLGVWIGSLFITIFFNNQIPMWIALIVMNIFYIILQKIKE